MRKIVSPEDLKGMTVNERLYHLELFEEYDKAVDTQDADSLREVLAQLHIGGENIEEIIKAKIGRRD